MKLIDIKGIKYPDEYIIKFFFKENLHQLRGDVLEFGCGNGNNLRLFYEYGWNVTGIDINNDSLADARHNFSISPNNNNYRFIQHDLTESIDDLLSGKYHVILFPSMLYYLPRSSVNRLLSETVKLIRNDTLIFLRARGIKDYRYGRGQMVERNAFILDIAETGEYGNLNVFYYEYELVDMLRSRLGLEENSMHIFTIDNTNIQKGITVYNSDIVIWGKHGRQL